MTNHFKSLYCFTIIFLLIFFINPKNVFGSLQINEIYPAPPTGEYEWVELYNNENKEINIEGFFLADLAGNKIKINENIIGAFSFIIATSTSILNNTGDSVFLKNNLNEILEIATYSGSFDNSKSYVKCPDGSGSWFILNLPTKRDSNEAACQVLTPPPPLTLTPTSAPTVTLTPTAEPTLLSYSNIYLSEVMVYPPSGENEWVEIYNDNDFTVFLTYWYLDDIEHAGSTPKNFSLEIAPKSYRVFELSSSIFNNSGDSVRLLDFNKSQKDSFEYSNAQQGKTYGRISFDSDDFCLQEPSKGLPNNNCLNPTATPTPKPTPSPTPFLTQKEPTTTVSLQSSKREISMIRMIKPRQITSTISHSFTTSEVLGASAEEKSARKNKLNTPLINSFSFLSFSYSLLTIVSVILKIKIKKI